jgi:hypothetical protein
MKKMPKNAENFNCLHCDFICSKKSNFDAHVLTLKHKKRTFLNNLEQKNAEKCQIFSCKNCQRTYSARNSLWYHERKCIETKSDVNELTSIVLEVVKQNQELMVQNAETQKQNQELTSKVIDLYKNGTINNTLINNNSNNKTFNLNLFLNETCKDAMNIMDFVDSIKLQLSDLENVGKMGYVEGISHLFVTNLNNIDYSKRPIHCSDSKREIFYIKDENTWTKDDEQKTTLTKAIKHVASKNIKKISEWQKANPDYNDPDSKKNDKYMQIVLNSMSGSTKEECDKNVEKIVKNIAKETAINKHLL